MIITTTVLFPAQKTYLLIVAENNQAVSGESKYGDHDIIGVGGGELGPLFP